MDSGFNVIDWLEQHLDLADVDTTAFIYDLMESQSGRCLPVIYQPFDAADPLHFADRGHVHDFSQATGGGRVLDFGPGDGWPSLIIAPFVDEVVGVDASAKRVEICRENAARLGIANARFVHVPAGEPLPFADAEFDGITAASSVEQTPDPRAALAELARVLRPGGRLRLHYEGLERYRGAEEHGLWLHRQAGPANLIVYDRRIDEELVRQYRLTLALTAAEAESLFSRQRAEVEYAALSEQLLNELSPAVTQAVRCTTRHPAGATWCRWLAELGFSQARPTHSGARFAQRLFDTLEPVERPRDLAAVDALLRPLVAVVIELDAPLPTDPMITAVK
ncbi:class I SAM-dependent methyltransferase [bacterium]|nr:class I SAM-dependent methyltransferase [bacterium]